MVVVVIAVAVVPVPHLAVVGMSLPSALPVVRGPIRTLVADCLI